jgi:hypothetical protein
MGVEFKRYLIPSPNDFSPSVKQLFVLLERLAANRWITTPKSASFPRMKFGLSRSNRLAQQSGGYARTEEGYESLTFPLSEQFATARMAKDLILCWPVENLRDAGLCYPLTVCDHRPEDTYYDLQMHFCRDYVYHTSELIDPVAEQLACSKCRDDLSFWPEESPAPHSLAGGKATDIFYSQRIRLICPHCGEKFDLSKLSATVRDGWTGNESRIHGGASYRFAILVDCGKCIPSKSGRIAFHRDFVSVCQQGLGCGFYEVSDLN